jgi:hypothetical protein
VKLLGPLAIFVLAAGLTACAALGVGRRPPPAVAARGEFRPAGRIDLGAYEREPEAKIVQDFSRTIAGRYAAGAPLSGVTKDLAANDFACAAPKTRGGDPPDRICRRVIRVGDCNHTWQVHLFDDSGHASVARVRGLYDRTCGEELLGR